MAGKHPKFVQEMFGHANISITLDTYSHVIEGMDGGSPTLWTMHFNVYCCRIAATGDYGFP